MAVNFENIYQHIDALAECTTKGAVTPRLMAWLLTEIAEALKVTDESADSLKLLLAAGDSDRALLGKPFISCEVSDGVLYLRGFEKYVEAGCVPVLFRSTRKRNPVNSFKLAGASAPLHKYGPKTKCLHCFGDAKTLKVSKDGMVSMATNSHSHLNQRPDFYADPSASSLIKEHTRANGKTFVPWGRSMVPVTDRDGILRMLRFRFFIGFVRPYVSGRHHITAADVVSNLATFSVVGMPHTLPTVESAGGNSSVRPIYSNNLKWSFSR